MTTEPLVSVGIPTYNRVKSLKTAIDSVANQCYSNLEIIISDNASVDETETLCRSYSDADKRIQYFKQPINQGPTANFEFVKEKATGTYFMWLGDDDYLDAEYIQMCVAELEKEPELIFVAGLGVYHKFGKGPIVHIGNILRLTSPQRITRLLKYLIDVEENSVFYGIYRRQKIASLHLSNVLAGDWIWIADLLLLGNARIIQTFVHRGIGANTSSTPENIVNTIGAPKWHARWPWLAIAVNIYRFIKKTDHMPSREKIYLPYIVFIIILLKGIYEKMLFLSGKLKSFLRPFVRSLSFTIQTFKLAFSIKQFAHPKSVIVLSTFPIHPPLSGGQNRIFYLCKEVSKNYNVVLLCLANSQTFYKVQTLSENFIEVQIPKNKEFVEREDMLSIATGVSAGDIAAMFDVRNNPFGSALHYLDSISSLTILSQPYLYPYIETFSATPFIYESHNVEHTLKGQIFQTGKTSEEILTHLEKIEKLSSEKALRITACSSDDASVLNEKYSVPAEKIDFIPNGVNLNATVFTGQEKRQYNKTALDKKGIYALFIGSMHQPNIEAATSIMHMAGELQEINFIIIGSVCDYFSETSYPKNVALAGLVNEEEKNKIFSYVDIALNPMISGSGTNLKIFDYAAAGIPILSTPIGMRGINMPKNSVQVCAIEEFPIYLRSGLNNIDVATANIFVRQHHGWDGIGKKLVEILDQLTEKNQ